MSVQRKQRLIHAVEMLAGVTVLCAGVTLGIIAGLGQTTSTAAASAIAGAAGIKVGTASFYLYGVFFLLQLLMLRSKFEWERCFQLLPILAHGALLNFFRYRFAPFQHLAPQGYLQQMLCFLCGMGLTLWALPYQKLQLHQLSRRGVLRAGGGAGSYALWHLQDIFGFCLCDFCSADLLAGRSGAGRGAGGHGDLCLAGRCAHHLMTRQSGLL